MLEEVRIADWASYSATGEKLDKLKAINFIFGTNGAGKTTISRVIADPVSYPSCGVTWKRGRPLECLVYNRDFIEKTYQPQLAGIFTLGETESDTLRKVEAAKLKVSECEDDLAKLEATLGAADNSSGKRAELKNLRTAFETECWKIKTKYDSQFKDAFTGVRNAQARFCDKVLAEQEGNKAAIKTIEELTKKSSTLFGEEIVRLSSIPTINAKDLLAIESDPILPKKVIGKKDVDVAALIRRLGNSDWVRQGLGYLETGSQCPFCQQKVEDDLSDKLNAYFDETYLNDIASINKAIELYGAHSEELVKRLEGILALESSYIDETAFRADLDRLSARIEANKRLLEGKKKEPSLPVALEGLEEITSTLSDKINAANVSIAAHNTLVDNLSAERATLISEIWKFLLEENSALIKKYLSDKTALDKAVQGLTASITSRQAQHEAALLELRELERSITSVQPTVAAINSLLSSFGFSGFRLKTAGDRDHLYEIIRDNGSNATTTLSEGEKSFVTFLYFYHFLRGSITETGMTSDRVVVFDDPVSSMDSDVLFIVSALIKRMLKEACEDTGQIKQVFLLTHNIYFHKEVSFDSKRNQDKCRAHETFWIVRKVDGVSKCVSYQSNPIKTSYELLWQEVRNPERSNMTIQNSMRRIIENYFKILGNIDPDEIADKFEGKDKQICASLFSWVNDGSHAVHDDLYISADAGVVSKYLDVFKRIFEETGHQAHYHMMMRSEPGDEKASPLPALATA